MRLTPAVTRLLPVLEAGCYVSDAPVNRGLQTGCNLASSASAMRRRMILTSAARQSLSAFTSANLHRRAPCGSINGASAAVTTCTRRCPMPRAAHVGTQYSRIHAAGPLAQRHRKLRPGARRFAVHVDRYDGERGKMLHECRDIEQRCEHWRTCADVSACATEPSASIASSSGHRCTCSKRAGLSASRYVG